MDHSTVRDHIDQALERIAPDLDVANLRPDRDLIESADLDSMDFLNLITAIEADLRVTIPERDYGKIRTLDTLVDYVADRVTL